MKKSKQVPPPETIKGFLIDIDGVLYVEKQPIRGAVEAIEYLQSMNIPFMLVTNTTRRSRYSLLTNLQQLGCGFFEPADVARFMAKTIVTDWVTEQVT